MKLKQLFDDDDAVSPVIGVILMVAITVILAAVIATFVLGLGDQVSNTAPQATFSFDYEEGASLSSADAGSSFSSGDGVLTMVHDGGDAIKGNELFIRGASSTSGEWSNLGGDVGSSNSEVRAGNSFSIVVDDGDTVRVVFEDSDGGSSATLGKWTGPDA